MTEIHTITVFLGWCSVINIGLLTISAILLMLVGNAVSSIHSKLFGLSQEKVKAIYFNYLGNYKIAILLFNLVPYLSLKIMS